MELNAQQIFNCFNNVPYLGVHCVPCYLNEGSKPDPFISPGSTRCNHLLTFDNSHPNFKDQNPATTTNKEQPRNAISCLSNAAPFLCQTLPHLL